MIEQLLWLAGCAIIGLLAWILELRHRCRVYDRHIKYLEEIWYEETFGEKPGAPPPGREYLDGK